jgi:hypothetical protein
MLCLAGGLVACTTQEASGTGGTSGGGSGGTTTAPGGSGGTTSTAGTTGSAATDGTACLPIGTALITDFTYTPSDAGTTDTAQARFGTSGTLQGGTAVWTNSATPLTSDVTQNNWHITGTIDNYSGFNLYLDSCNRVDASAYKGIQFKISGSLGGGTLRMGMGTLNDAVAASWLIAHNDTSATATNPGRCMPPADATLTKYSQSTCKDPEALILVTASQAPITLTWTDFTGGKPVSGVEPKDIISIYWYFVWTTGSSYPVDITLDDLSFISP